MEWAYITDDGGMYTVIRKGFFRDIWSSMTGRKIHFNVLGYLWMPLIELVVPHSTFKVSVRKVTDW